MFRIIAIVVRSLSSSLRSRSELVLENMVLRQQLAAFKARGRTPHIRAADRAFWVLLRRLWARWADALVIVKPNTVVRWHRAGFRLYWRWISRRKRTGRRPVSKEIRDLIRQMSSDNGWGAPRIHGELLMLGLDVSERTVSRYLQRLGRRPEARQSWLTFLHNHREAIAAMDLFVVFTVKFRLLYVLFIIRHGQRQIAHFNVTEHPTAAWVIQQLREAFPYDSAPKHLIFDRDSIFSTEVVAAIRAMGIKPTRTAYSSPWQNGTAGRWVGACRQELLDHVIVLGKVHLCRVLREYVAYHHEDRTHCGLGKQTPMHRTVECKPSAGAKVTVLPRLGGLHHRYEWRDAA